MLRRTLLAFVALLFLVLAITMGYAALGLSGPDTAVADARRALAAGRYAQCVRILDLAEQGLGRTPDPTLLQQILTIRHQAFHELGNVNSALRDLGRLRMFEPDDAELAERQIRWTIESGEPMRGLSLAEMRLARFPDEPRTVELAGEACQARYQEMVRDFLVEYGTLLDQESATKAFAALRTWLYRDADDPAAAEGFDEFEAVLRERRPAAYAAGDYAKQLQDMRELVTRAQRYFRKALESNDAQPVAAYLGLGYALRQGGRQDDLQWLAEIYLHRFDHAYTTLAANDLAQVHLKAGRYRAVCEVAERFLPRGTWHERLADGRLSPEVRNLRLAEARALLALGDQAGLDAVCQEVKDIQASGAVDLEPELHWILALDALGRKDYRVAVLELQDYDRKLAAMTPTEEIVARRIAVFEQRLAIAREQNWGPGFFEFAFRQLARLDQSNPRYFVERSRLRLEGNDVEGAMLDLRTATTLAQHDDEVLRMQAKVRDAQQQKAGRDSASQLKRCLDLGVDVPYDIDDILLLPLAERALEQGHAEIALACAQRAGIAFNWARWPRNLAARAAMALGRPAVAEQAAEELLAHHPDDPDGLLQLREARARQGEPIADLTFDLLVAAPPDPGVAASLLRDALKRGDLQTAQHVALTIQRRWASDPAAMLSVAEVQAALGDEAEARRTLQKTADATADSDPEIYAEATRRYFLLTAKASDDPALVERLFQRAVSLSQDDATRLLALGDDLRQADLDELAFRVYSKLLTDDRYRTARNGENFLVAGQLALKLGRVERAEQYLLAAQTFPEGRAASRPLALLLIARGRPTEAVESAWDRTVDDLPSACLSARAGRPQPAIDWAKARIAESPAHLPALALLALLDPKAAVPPPVRELAESAAPELRDALTFLMADGFADQALTATKALVHALPSNVIARTMLARAYAGIGDRQNALEILTGVVKDSPLLVPAYDAAARILDSTPGAPEGGEAMVDRFLDPELMQKGLATKGLLELAARRTVVRLLATLGEDPKALGALVSLWEAAPDSGEHAIEYAQLLASYGRPDLALELCKAIEKRVPQERREVFLTLYFHLYEVRLRGADDPALRASGIADAKRFLQTDGALGAIVHFLIDQDIAQNGPLDESADVARKAKARRLLDAHLARVRAGREQSEWSVLRTVQRIHDLEGRTQAITLAEELLREDPSRVELWLARSQWLVDENHVDDAVQSVHWMRDYIPSDPAMIGCVELAARAGRSQADDEELLRANLDAKTLETPSALHVLGLLAFRRADYARARDLLERGEPRADGAQLYFAGLAALILGDADTARADLEKLARDYPKSSLSFNAGHFARQLSF